MKHFYIYFTNFNVLVTPGNAYFRPEHYYETSHYNNLSLEEWKRTILDKTHSSEIMPLSPFINGGTQTSVITYMQSLPLDSFSDSSPATVVTIIDEKRLTVCYQACEMKRAAGCTLAMRKDIRLVCRNYPT